MLNKYWDISELTKDITLLYQNGTDLTDTQNRRESQFLLNKL